VKLSPDAFERRWSNGDLKIALIGMSNIGKSWMSAKLANALGIATVEVDHYIRRELGQESMDDFAQWLGHPNTSGYAKREAKSLALEETATLRALDDLTAPCILDTTGSVIYCPESCARLSAETYVVYLRASEKTRKILEALYFSHPKPLNWNGHFEQKMDELFGDAVARSYPKLLDSRDNAYADLSDHTILAEKIYETSDPHELFGLLKPAGE
jgi:shikimate kinase